MRMSGCANVLYVSGLGQAVASVADDDDALSALEHSEGTMTLVFTDIVNRWPRTAHLFATAVIGGSSG